jgi:hypothetical protein
MGRLDLTLFVVFGTISVLALLSAVLCFRKALRVANQKDGDIKMFLWAAGGMVFLIVSGMGAAYIFLPLLFRL